MSLDKERIPIVIGKNGETKKKIEELTNTKITIDSNTGKFQIEANVSSPDDLKSLPDDGGVRVYITQHILEAIGLGFNPEKALKLLNQESVLEIINLEEVLGHSEKKITRMKGRLIGDQGKIRMAIEQMSGVSFSVHKKFIALIGDFESIKIAKKAISMITQGAPHKTVLNYLQDEYQRKKQKEFTEMWKPTL